MKILLVTDLYPIEDEKTIPYAIEDIALALKDEGIAIDVIRPNFLFNTIIRGHKIYPKGIYERKGIKIYNRNFILPFLGENIDFLDEKYDLIISHLPSGTIYADLINKKLKLPRMSIIHYSDYRVLNEKKYSIYFKNRLKNALKNSSLIGARSKFLYDKCDADFILPSFIEKDYIAQNKEFSNSKLKIITLSKLIKRKNIDTVIKALSCVDFSFEYSIFGEGKEEKNLEKLIKKYNLQNKIQLKGAISHNKIWDELKKNDIFILVSKKETFGLSYLEALSQGLIVIARKNEGIDGVIENNKNGFLIERNEEISEILEDLLKNPNKMKEISNNALDRAKKYTKEEVIKNYLEIIKKII